MATICMLACWQGIDMSEEDAETLKRLWPSAERLV